MNYSIAYMFVRYSGGGIYVQSPRLVSRKATLEEGVCLYRNVKVQAGVHIGSNTYINDGSVVASGHIGKYCSIGYNVQIGMYEHPIDFVTTSERIYHACDDGNPCKEYKEIKRPPCIGNDVWVGSNAIIMQGVNIGDGAVIGASAVVTHNVKPYEIVAGIPAKTMRYRFSEEIIEKLLEILWWDKPDEWISKYKNLFYDPKILIERLEFDNKEF